VRSRIGRSLRVLPLATLAAVVAIAVAHRMQRRPESLRAPGSTTTVPIHTPSGVATERPPSAFDAPLLGPSPPPPIDAGAPAARTLHGSAKRAHRSLARGPRTIRVGWRVAVDGTSPVAAQVTVAPDEATLYVATLGGQLVALVRADGTRRWAVALGDRAYGAPLVGDDGTIYVGTDARKLFSVSAKGDTIFRLDTEGEADTAPVFGRDGAIVFVAGNHVHSVRRGGDLGWRFSARSKIYTAPAVTDEGLVIVGSQDDHVYALGAGGVLAWTIDLGADVDGSPAIADDGAIYVGTDAGDVVRLDPKGNLVWRTPVGGFVRGALSIARNGDVVVGTYGPVPRVVRVGPDGVVRGAFAIRGTGAKDFGIHGGPLEDADGVLYFGAQDDAVYAIGPDGGLRWRYETSADVDAPLTMLSDGSLVVPSEDGSVTLLLP
jgi:outer membrane protein assembly factor BamB